MPAQEGHEYVYDHPADQGYGESALGQPLTAEMTELDLKDGMVCFVIAFDEITGWPIISWKDGTGIDRITTIDEAVFDGYFVESAG
jgi:hypothetical protein